MTDKPTRLGRGLAALIGDMETGDDGGLRVAESQTGTRRLPVGFIVANQANPRRDFDQEQLEELAQSIREKGIMQPLLVRPVAGEPDSFEIIAGERRWRAAQMAGLNEVPVIIRDVDDREALELAIIENVQRTDLNPLEEAQGYGELMDKFSYTQQDLAHVIGKSRSHVANTLRLLRLPDTVRGMLADGSLSAGHARTLITADDPAGLAERIVRGGLSVRETEKLAQSEGRGRPARTAKSPSEPDPDTLALEKRLSDALGLKVKVNGTGESGVVEVRYSTLEQLDEICRRLEH